jgi:rSAM/selenodomain-associated transferase 1
VRIELVVMAKAPIPGFAKTRLVPPLTPGQAASLQAAFIKDVTSRDYGRWGRVLRVTGGVGWFDGARRRGWTIEEQGDGDLGERLSRASEASAARADAVVLVGTDSVDMPDRILEAVTSALAHRDVVVCPAEDGGYCLLATRGHRPWLYERMPWSQPGLARATIAACRQREIEPALVEGWYDVDNIADLRRLRLNLNTLSSGSGTLPRLTLEWLELPEHISALSTTRSLEP